MRNPDLSRLRHYRAGITSPYAGLFAAVARKEGSDDTGAVAPEGGTNRFVYAVAAVSALGGLLFGYDTGIISGAGIGGSGAILATTGVGLVNCLVTGAALLSIDRIGRRPLLLAGTAGVTMSLIVLGLAYLLPPKTALVNFILVVGLMVYIASFAASLGICIWLLNSDVCPLEVRGKGSATGSITHWVLDLIIASTVLTLINTITETGTFWLYAVFSIIGIPFFFRVVPETKGRTLEEIEEELERRTPTGAEAGRSGSGS